MLNSIEFTTRFTIERLRAVGTACWTAGRIGLVLHRILRLVERKLRFDLLNSSGKIEVSQQQFCVKTEQINHLWFDYWNCPMSSLNLHSRL